MNYRHADAIHVTSSRGPIHIATTVEQLFHNYLKVYLQWKVIQHIFIKSYWYLTFFLKNKSHNLVLKIAVMLLRKISYKNDWLPEGHPRSSLSDFIAWEQVKMEKNVGNNMP